MMEHPTWKEALKSIPFVDKGKNIVLTPDRVMQNIDLYKKNYEFFLAYPDLFLDMILPKGSQFRLFFYQRMFLRISMRYTYIFSTFSRGFSKSFLSVLALVLTCILLPRTKRFIVADVKRQGTQIAKEKVDEIFNIWPFLKNEVKSKQMQEDVFTLTFKNGSQLDVVGLLSSTRGGRRHGGLIEEVATITDEQTLNEVILPLMNVARYTLTGTINENEPHGTENYVTTAGNKDSFAYRKAVEIFIDSIIKPKESFYWGGDYALPILMGLYDKKKLEQQKNSITFSEDSFLRENMSRWTGGNSESAFNFERIRKYRVVVNAETSAPTNREHNDDAFYLIAVDVARTNDKTALVVLKVLPKEQEFHYKVVNIVKMANADFTLQAIELKRLISIFNPKEVVIDANNLGSALLDEMVKPTFSPIDGVMFPAYGVSNLDEWKDKSKNLNKLIYGIKANSVNNSNIITTSISKISLGKVRFLISDSEARTKLMATKTGARMKFSKKEDFLRPYRLTTELIEEMVNLRIKQTGVFVQVERINKTRHKDLYSALSYGIFRGEELAVNFYKNRRKKSRDLLSILQIN